MREVGPWGFVKRVWNQIAEDHVLVWASALAYSWMFAVFPFFIFLLTLTPYVPLLQGDEVIHQISDALHQNLPDDAADTLEKNIISVTRDTRGGLMSIGLVVALWAASGGMAMTMSALDRCYDVDINRPFYKQRPIALLLTIIVSVLVLAVLLLLPIGTIATNWTVAWLKQHDYPNYGPLVLAWNAVRWSLGVLLMFGVLMVVYHYGTAVRLRKSFFSPGAIFCVIVWILLGMIFRFYINRFGKYDQTYGTVGGVAILLLVFYLDALVLLVGAEINSEVDFAVLKVKPGTMDLRNKRSADAADCAGDPSMPSP